MFTIVGTLAQDVILEPYGALVLQMEVGDTMRLTSYWGIGVVIAMLTSGLLLVRYLGFVNLLRIGLVVSMISFGGVIFTGLNGQDRKSTRLNSSHSQISYAVFCLKKKKKKKKTKIKNKTILSKLYE